MNLAQPGILEAVPLVARYVSFTLAAEALAPAALPHLSRRLVRMLQPAFKLRHVIDAFRHKTGHDLTGYEDGTENPEGDLAGEAALVHGAGPGLDGSSYVAVQQWVHDFDAFEPPAFMLRRSMPWTQSMQSGLMFVAFGCSHRAFEVQMRRMAGQDDGVVDAMFGHGSSCRLRSYKALDVTAWPSTLKAYDPQRFLPDRPRRGAPSYRRSAQEARSRAPKGNRAQGSQGRG